MFVEAEEPDKEDVLEQEADEFAQNILIPPREYAVLQRMGKPSKADVEAFAERIGVDPGIIVGRLQHDGFPPNWFNDLKKRYKWETLAKK